MTADGVRRLIQAELYCLIRSALAGIPPVDQPPREFKSRRHGRGIFAAENAWRRSNGRAPLKKLEDDKPKCYRGLKNGPPRRGRKLGPVHNP